MISEVLMLSFLLIDVYVQLMQSPTCKLYVHITKENI